MKNLILFGVILGLVALSMPAYAAAANPCSTKPIKNPTVPITGQHLYCSSAPKCTNPNKNPPTCGYVPVDPKNPKTGGCIPDPKCYPGATPTQPVSPTSSAT